MTEPVDAGQPTPQRPLITSVISWLGGAFAAGLLIFWGLDALRVRSWTPWHQTLPTSEMYDLMRSTVAATGLLGATVAAAIAIRRQKSTETSVRISANAQQTAADAQRISAEAYTLDVTRHERETVRELRDRFTTAAGQLGNVDAAVRLAGVYGLAALADDWTQRDERPEAQACIDVLCGYIRAPRHGDTPEAATADLEVRQTIIRITAKRLQGLEAVWRGYDIDYSGGVFNGTYAFPDLMLNGAILSFERAQFEGGLVSFERAAFIAGLVNFKGARFAGGTVTFRDATFEMCVVSFVDAQFSGSTVVFDQTSFEPGDGPVSFDGAQISGGLVKLDQAWFRGGSITFRNAQAIRGYLSGPWASELPGEQWPVPLAH